MAATRREKAVRDTCSLLILQNTGGDHRKEENIKRRQAPKTTLKVTWLSATSPTAAATSINTFNISDKPHSHNCLDTKNTFNDWDNCSTVHFFQGILPYLQPLFEESSFSCLCTREGGGWRGALCTCVRECICEVYINVFLICMWQPRDDTNSRKPHSLAGRGDCPPTRQPRVWLEQ